MIDANEPAEILNSFGVSASYILCIASVPGASLNDYEDTTADDIQIEPRDNNASDKCAQNNVNITKEEGETKEDDKDEEQNVS